MSRSNYVCKPLQVTTRFKETLDYVFILAELSTKAICNCAIEGAVLEKHGMTRPMKLLDCSIRNKFTEIYYRLRRFRCSGCEKTVQQPVAGRFIKEISGKIIKHNMTNRLGEYIERESLYPFKSFRDISLGTGVGSCVVSNIFTDYVEYLEGLRVIITPRFLALDEAHLTTKKRDVRCIITSPEDKLVLDILKDNERTTIKKWLKNLPNPEIVEVVSMDMCPTYISVIEENLSHAAIVLDRYHIHNLLNVELKAVLAVVRESLTFKKHREMMRRDKLVLKSRHHLSDRPQRNRLKIMPSEKDELEEWLKAVPLLKIAYELKESFSDILQLADRAEAEKRMDHWLVDVKEFTEKFQQQYDRQCKEQRKFPFNSTLFSFSRHRKYILNYIDYKTKFNLKVTNAFAELANKQIKKAHAIGSGIKHEVLRAKFIYGGILKKKMPMHPLQDDNSAKPRKRVKKSLTVKKIINPDSNISRLKKAVKEQDKFNGLVQLPQENEEFNKRFGSSKPLDSEPGMANFGIIYEDEKVPDLLFYEVDERNFLKSSEKIPQTTTDNKKKTKSCNDSPPPLFKFFDK